MSWGSTPWGAGEWSGGGDQLAILNAVAIRENVVRITFSDAPYWSGVFDVHDASNPERYAITPVAGTTDGFSRATRPVTVVGVEQHGAGGAQIDVTTDRPMASYPAEYIIAVNRLQTEFGELLDTNFSSYTFLGLYRLVQPLRLDSAIPSRDLANPQTLQALLDPLPETHAAELLGTIPVNADGDYAFDEGITNLKKRIYRRLLTSKGAFAALPDYGVGVLRQVKKLGTAAVRNQLANEAQKQISQEPDVLACSVKVVSDPDHPAITRFKVRVKTKFSGTSVTVDVPFSPTE